jgi:signal transduction histidine kinase
VTHTLGIIATALLWGTGGAVAAWLLTWPLRRRSQVGVLVSVAAIATASSVAAVIGNTRAMFIAMDDEYVTIIAALVAGLVAAIAAGGAARNYRRDSNDVRRAVDAIREGRFPDQARRRLSGELADLRAELDRTARTLAESRQREQALEASRRELVSWVSHDLRTPMAGLRAMAEALEDGVAASPERYHKQIRIEVDRLTGMVDDLFQLSRLQAGSPRARIDQVDLADLVSDCVAAVEPIAARQGVVLLGRAETGVEVCGDGSELNRALANLLYNAIRHTGTGGRVEILLTGAQDSVTKTAVLTVTDECGGIAESDLGKVFDVGFRGEPARTPHRDFGAGAGLGLAITRGIVTAHRGTVEVHNEGHGCAFRLRLPLAP